MSNDLNVLTFSAELVYQFLLLKDISSNPL